MGLNLILGAINMMDIPKGVRSPTIINIMEYKFSWLKNKACRYLVVYPKSQTIKKEKIYYFFYTEQKT